MLVFFKLNLFLRTWKGYDKVYKFLRKQKVTLFCLKALLYSLLSLSALLSNFLLAIIIITFLIPIEFFLGCITKENNEQVTSFLSFTLMLLDIFILLVAIFNLIS